MELLYLIIGFFAGFLFGKKNKPEASDGNQLVLLNQQIHELDTERTVLKDRINGFIDKISAQQQQIETQKTITDNVKEENITVKVTNKSLQEKLQSQKIETEGLQKKFAVEFENIANRILKQNTSEFSETNQKRLIEILNPLKDKLGEFEEKVQNTYEKGLKERSTLAEQIKSLSELNLQMQKDAQNLTSALKGDSKTQGNWGEMQLEKILEKAGLEKNIHYLKEQNVKTNEGTNQRLDYIINLPDNKHLILDSKVSLTAYNNYYNENDEILKERYFKEHLDSINTHINLLGSKNYHELGIHQPDYVMLFLANEPALTLALKKDNSLFEKALEKNIVLVTTSTLLATLRTISYIWKTDNQNRYAKEIASQAGGLYDKFVGFINDLDDVGKKMDSATKSYESAYKKLSTGRGNLVSHADKLRKLGASSSKIINKSLLENSDDDTVLNINELNNDE